MENMIEHAEKYTTDIKQLALAAQQSGVVRTAITKLPTTGTAELYSSSDEHASGDLDANRVVVKLTPESASAYKSTFMKNTKKAMDSTQAVNKISSREDEDDIVEPEEEEEEEE